jgi:polyisoprenoid-binding protein YceI
MLDPEGSKMTIEGTSSLHNWQMEVNDMNCLTKFAIDGRKITSIQSLEFSCLPTSIVSDSKLMDKKTYEALKVESYSKIDFKMIKGEIISRTGDEFNGMVTGNLFIAGQTREIKVPFRGNFLDNGQLMVEGKVDLKMSEFKIEPPTAMFGTLKTGDEISIIYSFMLDSPGAPNHLSELKSGSSKEN